MPRRHKEKPAFSETHLLPVSRRESNVELRQHQPDVLAVVLPYPARDQQITACCQAVPRDLSRASSLAV